MVVWWREKVRWKVSAANAGTRELEADQIQLWGHVFTDSGVREVFPPALSSLVTTSCPQVGVVKITWRLNFWQISIYISKTVQNRYTYNWRLTRIVYGLSNGSNGSDLEWLSRSFTGRRSNICAALYTISTDSMLARSLCVSWASCPIRTRSFRARDTIFGGFCDHNQDVHPPRPMTHIPLSLPTLSFTPFPSPETVWDTVEVTNNHE